MTTPIDIRADHLRIVHDVLARHLPDGVQVWVFGSRATWATKDSSDLDLALAGDGEISARSLAALESAFEESDLPYTVDVVDIHRIGERFRRIVDQQRVRFPESDTDSGARSDPARRVSLRDLCEAVVDCPHSTPAWTPDGVIVLRSKNIRNGRLDLSQPSYTSEKDYAQRIKRATPRAGDLVITREAPMGEVCMIPEGLRCCLGQRMVLLRPSRVATDPRYLLYALQSEPVQEEIRSHDGTGSTVSNLRISLLEALGIPSHPLSEQRAIARVLGTLDDKMELNRRMNVTLEAMARALFRSWFVDFDPVRAKMAGRDTGLPKEITDLFPDRMVDSAQGEIPEGWTVGTLGDIVAVPRSGVDPGQVADDTPYIGLEHMPRRSVALTDWGRAGSVSSIKTAFENRDVLFGKLRPYFHKVGIAPVNGVCSTDIVVLKARMPEWPAFVLACVSSSRFVSYASQTSTGTKMPRTSWRTMSRYEMCRPAVAVAAAFQHVVSPMFERIVANVHESRTRGRLRDALLPKLVSGELRVDRLESATGSVDNPAPVGMHRA